MQEDKNKTKLQAKIDGMLDALCPQEFSQEIMLHAVAQFVVCDDQVCIWIHFDEHRQ